MQYKEPFLDNTEMMKMREKKRKKDVYGGNKRKEWKWKELLEEHTCRKTGNQIIL